MVSTRRSSVLSVFCGSERFMESFTIAESRFGTLNWDVWTAALCTAFRRRGAPGHCVPNQSGAERRTPYEDGS